MKIQALVALVGLQLAYAEPNPEDRYVKLDVTRVSHPLADHYKRDIPDFENELVRRANQDFADNIVNQKFYYSTTVGIGTPEQKVNLLLDTGSSDTWVYTPQSRFQGPNNQRPQSTFDPSKSSTWKSNNTQYTIRYGIGEGTGQWGTDVFKIGSAQVKSLTIGAANTGSVSSGIIGIGRPEAETTAKQGQYYENLPMKLKSEGLTHTAAYSLYLNSINSKSGTILFGAVDHSKYSGRLYALPISHPKHLGVTLRSLRTDGVVRSEQLDRPTTAILDSGTSLTYFPGGTVDSLHTALNANPSFTIGQRYYCDCNVTEHLLLNFGPVSIKVPNYFFLWPIETVVNRAVAAVAFPQNSCYIGIESQQPGMDYILLGDNFLRAFYTVYDITNEHIAIAQASFSNGDSKIEVIKDKIPGAVYSS